MKERNGGESNPIAPQHEFLWSVLPASCRGGSVRVPVMEYRICTSANFVCNARVELELS